MLLTYFWTADLECPGHALGPARGVLDAPAGLGRSDLTVTIAQYLAAENGISDPDEIYIHNLRFSAA
ncbi:hypothetical protein RM844_30225 [Streptomyces sp. DSM 44915]|uniref:Uncharacterized protein n=1 Tax=Streptomyces chisholmiae TaxID=3075540 RepID=A0ABU2JZY0_9ACTN|nr:hypothetical protein [Streptomyces sp. DSM 44915]MDT0270558.1 hypothetical protein [Streptomyces sp. DSM 44915]